MADCAICGLGYGIHDRAVHATFRRTGHRARLSQAVIVPTKWPYCHYCGGVPTTRDHIVPRMLLPPGHDNTSNVVPSCAKCNREKGNQRSDCDCRVCRAAWEMYGPEGWLDLPRIAVGWRRRSIRPSG